MATRCGKQKQLENIWKQTRWFDIEQDRLIAFLSELFKVLRCFAGLVQCLSHGPNWGTLPECHVKFGWFRRCMAVHGLSTGCSAKMRLISSRGMKLLLDQPRLKLSFLKSLEPVKLNCPVFRHQANLSSLRPGKLSQRLMFYPCQRRRMVFSVCSVLCCPTSMLWL